MDAERLGWVTAAVALGVSLGASFGSGKTLLLERWHYPRIVQRRKEPFEFWIMIAVQVAVATICVWGAVKIST